VSIHTGGKDVVVGENDLSLMKPTAFLSTLHEDAT